MDVWRVVMFQEKGQWVAHCLEHDMAAQAATITAAIECFKNVALGYARIAQSRGLDPFVNLPKAPRKYFDMYELGVRLMDSVILKIPEMQCHKEAQFAIYS